MAEWRGKKSTGEKKVVVAECVIKVEVKKKEAPVGGRHNGAISW